MTENKVDDEPNRGLLLLCLLAVVAGVFVGFIGGAFRWCLRRADNLRQTILDWSHQIPYVGWLVPVALVALCTVLAVLIVRRVPLAAGSGIQHVEAVARGEAKPPGLILVPARFVGGLLAIGSGLVLGREGPTVHMGAAIGAETGRRASLPESDVRLLQTSMSGAGLAVAFNAPIGGALFVCEEVTHSFTLRTVLPTMFGVAVAVGCSRLISGDRPDFAVDAVPTPQLALLPLFVVFGLLTGLLGICYNHMILGMLNAVARLRRIPPTIVGLAIGAIIGLTLFIDPLAGGGGDPLSQLIVGGRTFVLPIMLLYLVVRFFTGPLSYSAGTPGGLFAPLLAVGALWGSLFAGLSSFIPGVDGGLTIALSLVGMAAFFGAVVRAPFTGIVIVVEMTTVTSALVPMLAATAAAVLVATLAGSAPIYDILRKRMLATQK
ncbi:ClC family H(+)/Cl(-) exchange transporter [Rhodococcus sp. IEGM 1379]|uniref:ClC family H(+)/Cl(-) exchange transporter n=1 Tax=Rhodococcus sp. IEGM 1379 TaxID=3047086 RepID=UPI0024B65E30|nr:ClC family H(+)/Cl(-) exchange transporter [Rhodococcus sp. IEGM 1379]MDI9913895.1 ClC family H(+)/Cl(-) exchange transporter [Rhodococcus sp. IEGM 1379]